jgi:hypothetical protein
MTTGPLSAGPRVSPTVFIASRDSQPQHAVCTVCCGALRLCKPLSIHAVETDASEMNDSQVFVHVLYCAREGGGGAGSNLNELDSKYMSQTVRVGN